MNLSKSQELQLQGSDLEEMAAHRGFRSDIIRGKRSPNKMLLAIARKYWITDLDWLRHVIKTWDGRAPLPTPNDRLIKRSHPSRYDLWRGADGVISVETESFEASPRMLSRKLVTVDRLGSRWLVLRVRLFPGLSAAALDDLTRDSLAFAFHRPATNKKPSRELVAHQYLASLSIEEQSRTTYHLGKRVAKELHVSFESGKKYVRSWKKSYAAKGNSPV